jgi:hypothetical protein
MKWMQMYLGGYAIVLCGSSPRCGRWACRASAGLDGDRNRDRIGSASYRGHNEKKETLEIDGEAVSPQHGALAQALGHLPAHREHGLGIAVC